MTSPQILVIESPESPPEVITVSGGGGTNKRTLVLSAKSPNPAINTDLYDAVRIIDQDSVAIESFSTNLTGTPADGDILRVSVTGSGAVSLSWGDSFESSIVSLPTTTTPGDRLDAGFFWNPATSKWRCVGVS